MIIPLQTSLPLLACVRNAASQAEIDENIRKYKAGSYEKLPNPDHLQHFRSVTWNIENISWSLKEIKNAFCYFYKLLVIRVLFVVVASAAFLVI